MAMPNEEGDINRWMSGMFLLTNPPPNPEQSSNQQSNILRLHLRFITYNAQSTECRVQTGIFEAD